MSDIKFNCPKCDTHLKVDATGAGSEFTCPNCGHSIIAPKLAQVAEIGSSGQAKWWLLSVGLAASIVIIGFLFWQTHLQSINKTGSPPNVSGIASHIRDAADKTLASRNGGEKSYLVSTPQAIVTSPATTPTSGTQTAPQVWFAPNIYKISPSESQNGEDSYNFMDLFRQGAAWSKASNRVKVFKLYEQAFNGLSDFQLNQVVTELKRHGIAIGMESPLIWVQGRRVEDVVAKASDATLLIARRVHAAGGVLGYVAMDEPFLHGSYWKPPKGAGLPVMNIARGVADYIQNVKREFPNVIIGDIEPSDAGVDGVEQFLDAYRDVAREDLPFLHLDVQWESLGIERAQLLENYAHAHGIVFGIIYDGLPNALTDAIWVKQAEHNIVSYETLFGGHPDQIIFQSWHEHPHYLLPETDSSKFTWLINHYFTQRTKLIVDLSSLPPDQPCEAVGKLMTSTGLPLGGAQIALAVKSTNGTAQMAEYTFHGIVPEQAKQAIVGFRVNEESHPKACNFTLYDVSYREETDNTERVFNNNFGQGLKKWSIWPAEAAHLQPNDHGPGQELKVIATAAQKASMNSTQFAVTSNAAYTLTFHAAVTPYSAGCGYFAIFFQRDSEGYGDHRQKIPLEPAAKTYSVVTDHDGSFRLKLDNLTLVNLRISGQYEGDDDHWSAYSSSGE